MKPLLLLLSIFVMSCASKTPPVVKVEPVSPGRNLSREEARRVRLPESLKAYPLGRYVDPHHRGVMHESHTIYRVETTPKWNFARQGKPSVPVPQHLPSADLSRNELLVELTRQREATKAVMRSGQDVSSKLTDLATSLHKNQQALAEQNAGIRQDLKTTRERLETLEGKVNERPTPAPENSPTMDDDPW